MCFLTEVGLKYIFIFNFTITSVVFEILLNGTARYTDSYGKLKGTLMQYVSKLVCHSI